MQPRDIVVLVISARFYRLCVLGKENAYLDTQKPREGFQIACLDFVVSDAAVQIALGHSGINSEFAQSTGVLLPISLNQLEVHINTQYIQISICQKQHNLLF